MADGDGLLHACLVDVPNDHDVLIQSEDQVDELIEKILDFLILDLIQMLEQFKLESYSDFVFGSPLRLPLGLKNSASTFQ
jgi:hypothetical protein